ncbi:MAG: DUF5615 family PIN-like protein [Anaerolineae bacterium]
MKVLLDSCISSKTRDELRSAGYDTDWVGDWRADPGDDVILAAAHSQGRVCITIDKDFGELAIVRKLPHSGIVRLVDLSLKQQAIVCLHVLKTYASELENGAIVTAEISRVRVRPADDK